MNEQTFEMVELSRIRPSPLNPRKVFDGPDFDEFVASILEKGVISPVLVRPVDDDGLELVFGERRWRGACRAAEQNGGTAGAVIPAIVRELSDEEAFDLMTIENLQRKDLSELEEAESFRGYVERHGEGAVVQLAQKTGINEKYIRRRVAVLKLPKKTLKAWSDGALKYGHLEQFCRLDNKKDILALTQEVVGWSGGYSVRRLREKIDERSPLLKTAKFDPEKEGCLQCQNNSDIQKRLFDLGDMDNAHCLDPVCFKKKQNNHFLKNWKKTGFYKRHHTTGFRFRDDLSWEDYEDFYSARLKKKCRGCDGFVTLIRLDGTSDWPKVCIGDKACFRTARAGKSDSGTNGKKEPRKAPAWHGQFFRERFYEEQLPLRYCEVPAGDEKIGRLSLFSFIDSNPDLHGWFAMRHGSEKAKKRAEENPDAMEWFRAGPREIFGIVSGMTVDQVNEEFKAASLQYILHGTVHDGRHLAAGHIGIDLGAEWTVTEEWLNKKTIAEIHAFAEENGLWDDPRAQAFLYEKLLKKRGKFKSCKKDELTRLILESGLDLKGKVPAEVLAIDAAANNAGSDDDIDLLDD